MTYEELYNHMRARSKQDSGVSIDEVLNILREEKGMGYHLYMRSYYHKIRTIKIVRILTGWGLKDSKLWVERSLIVRSADRPPNPATSSDDSRWAMLTSQTHEVMERSLAELCRYNGDLEYQYRVVGDAGAGILLPPMMVVFP